jgi:hypothetical protein
MVAEKHVSGLVEFGGEHVAVVEEGDRGGALRGAGRKLAQRIVGKRSVARACRADQPVLDVVGISRGAIGSEVAVGVVGQVRAVMNRDLVEAVDRGDAGSRWSAPLAGLVTIGALPESLDPFSFHQTTTHHQTNMRQIYRMQSGFPQKALLPNRESRYLFSRFSDIPHRY